MHGISIDLLQKKDSSISWSDIFLILYEILYNQIYLFVLVAKILYNSLFLSVRPSVHQSVRNAMGGNWIYLAAILVITSNFLINVPIFK